MSAPSVTLVWSETDFLEVFISHHVEPSDNSHQDEQEAAGTASRTYVDSLQSEVWTSLFREHSEIFSPLWPWVHQMHRAAWWDVAVLKANVIACLCHYRLDEEALVQELQPFLQTQMARFVQQLIDITVDKCHKDLLYQLEPLDSSAASEQDSSHKVDLEGSQDTRDLEDSAVTTPSPAASLQGIHVPSLLSSSSPAGPAEEELPSTTSTALGASPSYPPTACVSSSS